MRNGKTKSSGTPIQLIIENVVVKLKQCIKKNVIHVISVGCKTNKNNY